MHREKIICPICKSLISKNGFKLHLEAHSRKCITNAEKVNKRQHLDHASLNCKYCGKLCKNSKSVLQHEIRCRKNPSRISYKIIGFNNTGRKAWNRGLSKEICPQLIHSQESIDKARESRRGYKHSEAVIQKMKNNPKVGGLRKGSGRGKKGHYKGLYCDSTYELIWTIYCLDHSINFKRCSKSYSYFYKHPRLLVPNIFLYHQVN